MKRSKTVLWLGVVLFGFIGYWMEGDDLSATAKAAREYLEQQGYKVLAYEEQSDRYTLTESKIEAAPYHFYWGLPGNDPSPYIGKTVAVETFIVKNHPLDHWECCDGVKSKGKTYTYVFVVDNQVVGGISAPFGIEEAGLSGDYWSLDGKVAEH